MNLPDLSAISMRYNVPYVMVTNEAFQLNLFSMRSHPSKNLTKRQRIFNYRLSRARRVVENAFRILASRWRILHKPLNTSLETADPMIKATVCLYNLLMNSSLYCGENYANKRTANGRIINGEWRNTNTNQNNFNDGASFGSNNYTRDANEVRNILTDYFMNKGQVPWQDEMI